MSDRAALQLAALLAADRAAGARSCRWCGCTDSYACPGGCSWAGSDRLCSACAERCPHLVISDEGTAYCALAESQGRDAAIAGRRVVMLEMLLDAQKTEVNGIPWREFIAPAERLAEGIES